MMKKLLTLVAALVLSVNGSFAATPPVDAMKAAKIATDYLNSLGGSERFITSVTLDRGAMISGKQSWMVRWSKSIDDGLDKEIGLRVKMDGSIARVVESKASKSGRNEPASQGIR